MDGPPALPAQVTVESNKTAVSGKKASLSCSYGLPEKVQQVTWKHTSAEGVITEVASYAKRSDPMIEPPYQGRVWLSASLSDSQLTIQPVAIQDEGCYTCLYTTHPEGDKSSTVCLATYGKHVSPVRCHCWSLYVTFEHNWAVEHSKSGFLPRLITDMITGCRPVSTVDVCRDIKGYFWTENTADKEDALLNWLIWSLILAFTDKSQT